MKPTIRGDTLLWYSLTDLCQVYDGLIVYAAYKRTPINHREVWRCVVRAANNVVIEHRRSKYSRVQPLHVVFMAALENYFTYLDDRGSFG